jgi:hypothetical protein
MESVTLDKKDKATPEMRPLTSPTGSSGGELKYTLIVKDEKKKYPQVYTGSCCQGRIKAFTKNDKDDSGRRCACLIS